MSTNFNTTNETFRKLMGNGLAYETPSFQRDYSWGQEEWEELWDDILGLMDDDGENEHYMGYLVLQTSDNKQHSIIDGQQRLTTLSMIILAAIYHLNEMSKKMDAEQAEANKKRAEQLRSNYIGYLDTETLVTKSKLTLNRHNDDFYQTYIVPLDKMPQRGLRTSEHALRKSLEWFKQKMPNHANSGEQIARLINLIADKLFFTVITVTDELQAFKVFETLNTRGVRLSSTDLLKNYLFSIAAQKNTHNQELERMEQQWERLVNTLGEESFPDFLRVFWNSRYKFSRKSELFKTIRNTIDNKQDAFALLRGMDHSSEIYMALKTPHDRLWKKNEGQDLKRLKFFHVKQPLSLLLSCYEKFAEGDRDVFQKVLHAVVVISFRYNIICGLHTNDQEQVYVRVAKDIADGKLTTKKQIFDELKSIYPEDHLFQSAFEEKELDTSNSRNKKIVRYILFELERQISKNSYDFERDTITIEHICPVSAQDSSWSEETEQHVYRIGNMTLLDAKPNKDVGNKSYAEKLPIYKGSRYHITNSLAEYTEWNQDKIFSRQRDLAKQAKAIWRLEF